MAYTVAFPQSYLLESKLLVHLIYSTARTYGNLYSRVKIWLVWTRYLWVLVDELDQNNSNLFDSLLVTCK